MQFTSIFSEYYTLYRGDSDVPPVNDVEWIMAVRFANTALRRLEHVDGEDWEWLWTDTAETGNSQVYTTSSLVPVETTYTCPANMVKPGGVIRLTDPASGHTFSIDVVGSYNVQRVIGSDRYAFFTGDQNTGFTLHIVLNGTSYVNYQIDFPYYKQLTYFNTLPDGNGGVQEDGTTITECPDSNYLVNYLLAYRYRSTRNYPSYQTAQRDAEESLKGMQIRNRTGVDGHSWNSIDSTSGGIFGI